MLQTHIEHTWLEVDGLRSDMTGRLHEITVPTLLIHGAQDSAMPLSYAQKAHALIEKSSLRTESRSSETFYICLEKQEAAYTNNFDDICLVLLPISRCTDFQPDRTAMDKIYR